MREPFSRREAKLMFRERDKALRLQTKELHRRLDDLNHAHERAVEVQHTYVTDEKFSDFVKRYEENKEVTQRALTLAAGVQQGASGVSSAALAWGGFLIALVGVVVLIATR